MDLRLGSKYAFDISMFVYFSIAISFLLVQGPPSWCWRTVCITVLDYLTVMTVGQRMQALPVDHSQQLRDSISTSDVNRYYYILSLFLFVLLLFVFLFYFSLLLFVFFFSFIFQGQQHDFYKYIRIWILCCYYNVNELEKTLIYNELRQLRLISSQLTSESEAGLWIFFCRFLRFVYYIVRIYDQGCFGVYSQSNLLDRIQLLYSY